MINSVAIVGAGAMGRLFAARMAEAGASVTLIDVDAERLAIMAEQGIDLHDDAGRRVIPVGASLAAAVAGPVDLVMLFTKGIHSAAAIASVAHLGGARPIALTLQNGLGNAELLGAAFGNDRVVMGTAHVPADIVGETGVRTHGFADIHVGPFQAGSEELARSVAALLDAAGFQVDQVGSPAVAVWEKAAFNAALNAIGMICQAPNARVNNPAGRRIAAAVVSETVAVAAAGGLPLDEAAILANIDAALVQHGGHKASMLQDREAGRPTEIETINGAISREGQRLGVPTPVCDTLSDLVRVIEWNRHPT